MIKSEYDTKEYKALKLSNGLDVIIISDMNNDTSVASMVVNVGYLHDKTYGTAHFVEHMLFMGNEKYPQENHYQQRLNSHGGSSNAYTTSDHTCYYFSVLSSYFEEILDIFGHFFVNPLFNKESVDREMNAVDSEHKKNKFSEAWRYGDVLCDIAKRGHPFTNFSTGSLKTLKTPGIYEIMIEFYKKYYSAHNMKLCVLTNKPLDAIENMVKSIFSFIPTNKQKYDRINEFPFTSGRLLNIVPNAKEYKMIITWQLVRDTLNYKYKPLSYLTHILSNESKNSFFDILKKSNILVDINVELIEEFYDIVLYGVIFYFTKKSFKLRYEVIDAFFHYLNNIKQYGIMKEIYDEKNKINKLNFDYNDKPDFIRYVIDISNNMIKYPIEYCLAIDTINNPFDDIFRELVYDLLDDNMTKQKAIISMFSKQFASKTTKKSKWLHVHYDDVVFVNNQRNFIIEKIGNSTFLKQNEFIPKQITIYPQDKKTNTSAPEQITQNLYFKFDNTKPLIYIGIVYKTDQFHISCDNYVITSLFVTILTKYLDSELFNARLINNDVNISLRDNKLILTIVGYNTTIELLLNIICHHMIKPKWSMLKKYYKIAKHSYLMGLRNYIYSQPFIHSLDNLYQAISPRMYPYNTQLECLKMIKYPMLKQQLKQIITNLEISGFIIGNVNYDILKSITNIINTTEYSLSTYAINSSPNNITIKNLNQNDINNGIVVSFVIEQIKKNNTKDWDKILCLLLLVHEYVNEAFFDSLRTNQQLGYIVRSTIGKYGPSSNSLYTYNFIVQSPVLNGKGLEKRIMEFVEQFELKEKLFDEYVQSCKMTIMKKSNTVYEEFFYYFDEVKSETYIFDIKQILANTLDNLKFQHLSDFYNKYFLSNQRKCIVSMSQSEINKMAL